MQDKDAVNLWQILLCWSIGSYPDKTQSLLEVNKIAMLCLLERVKIRAAEINN